jgi:photosystem II stability/assembly factor-like uncharacterized protein
MMKYLSSTIGLKCCILFLGTTCMLGVLNWNSKQAEWEKLSEGAHPHLIPLLSAFFFDNNNGIAVTPLSLKRTNDSGKTWTTQLSNDDTGQAYYSILFTSPTTGFIVGLARSGDTYTPLILRTEDKGRNWQASSVNVLPRAKSSIRPQLNSISFCNEQVGWAAGTDFILYTNDGGRNWKVQRSGHPNESLLGVQCVSPDRAWAVGRDGLILYTENGGGSWTNQDSNTKSDLLRVRFYNGSGWIVGGLNGRGTILHTRDNGATWEELSIDVPEILFDIYLSNQQGWMVGASGIILHTNDGGESWQPQESPTSNDLVNIFFLSPHQGWIVGDKNTVLRLRTDNSLQ